MNEELHADEIGRPDVGLDVEEGPAVCGEADKFGIDCDALCKQVGPASPLAPVGEEGTPNGRVEHDEALVALPEGNTYSAPSCAHGLFLGAEDFTVGAEVEAGGWAEDGADVGGALGDLEGGDGFVVDAVHNEDEVGG